MRRSILALLLLLTSCGEAADQKDGGSPAASSAEIAGTRIYQASGRSGLCLGDGRAGFIVYADEGDSNCTVRGTVQRSAGTLLIAPDGDQTCRIEASEEGSSLTLGQVTPACAYYCGPPASYAGVSFGMVPGQRPPTDLAGDPLC